MMKKLHILACIFSISFLLFSCNGDQANVDASGNEATKEQAPPLREGESKDMNAKVQAEKDALGNSLVESTVKVEDAPVSDQGINYKEVAKLVCNCSKKYLGTVTEQEGDVFVSNTSSKYKDAVDCFYKKKRKLGIGDLNRNSVVRNLKNECHTIPPPLVMELVIAIAKNQATSTAVPNQ